MEFEEVSLEVAIKTHHLMPWNTSSLLGRWASQCRVHSRAPAFQTFALCVWGRDRLHLLLPWCSLCRLQSGAEQHLWCQQLPFCQDVPYLLLLLLLARHCSAFCWVLFRAASLYFCGTANTDGVIVSAVQLLSQSKTFLWGAQQPLAQPGKGQVGVVPAQRHHGGRVLMWLNSGCLRSWGTQGTGNTFIP